MRAADQVLIGALDAETGQRGFMNTGLYLQATDIKRQRLLMGKFALFDCPIADSHQGRQRVVTRLWTPVPSALGGTRPRPAIHGVRMPAP
jgi:hypothetical protein